MATAIVFSNLNLLTLTLVEELLNNGCEVYLVSHDHKNWPGYLEGTVKDHRLKIFADNRYLPRECNYVFSVNGFGYDPENGSSASNTEDYVVWAAKYAKENNSKLITVLSYVLNNDLQKKSFETYKNNKASFPQNSLAIFTADIYGKKMQLADGGLATQIIRGAVFDGVISLPSSNQNIYVSFVGNVVSQILSYTFSFGISEKEIALGDADSTYNFYQTLSQIKPGISSVQENRQPDLFIPNVKIYSTERQNLDHLNETISWLSKYAVNTNPSVVISKVETKTKASAKPIKIKKQKKGQTFKVKLKSSQKFLMASLLGLIIILSSPFIAFIIALFGINYSYAQFQKGNVESVERVLVVSTNLARFSKNGLLTLSNLPLIGGFFDFSKDISGALELSGQVALEALDLSKEANILANSFFGNGEADIISLSGSLYEKSQRMYTKFSLLNSQIDRFPHNVKSMMPLDSLDEYSSYLYALTKISPQLPELLGVDRPKTYLVLFQNNMELRPTGGFIGSFALITLEKGKLANIDVHDVYAADGQLKGYIEPPSPIKNYLGEATWYLRDSNWDPDFSESAKRAEWFLAKEIDRQVDGVVGVDMELAKSLLAFTGPVTLADFNQTVDEKNVYEKIQYQVETEFFPGSQRKDNILTSLVKTILAELANIKREDAVSLSKITFSNLRSKHIQLYLHNLSAQEGIVSAGWGGSLEKKKCVSFNCQAITAGIVEANVGVNKANYFVKRNMDISTKIVNGKFDNTLAVTIQNTASPALGLSGRYKAYLRNFIETGSTNMAIEVKDASGSKYVDPEFFDHGEFTEMGTVFEVQPNQSKTIIFKWQVSVTANLARPGSLTFNLRKQAGTQDDLVLATLTLAREVKYNTNLSEDKAFTASW